MIAGGYRKGHEQKGGTTDKERENGDASGIEEVRVALRSEEDAGADGWCAL